MLHLSRTIVQVLSHAENQLKRTSITDSTKELVITSGTCYGQENHNQPLGGYVKTRMLQQSWWLFESLHMQKKN